MWAPIKGIGVLVCALLVQASGNLAFGATAPVEAALESVVVVETADDRGTGFALENGRRIVTAARVVGGASSATLTLSDGTVGTAEVLAADHDRGVAILRSQQEVPALSAAFASRNMAVTALGSSIAVGPSIAHGRLTSGGSGPLTVNVSVSDDDRGAPLLDRSGQAVGLITGRGGDSNGTAVSIDQVKRSEQDAGLGVFGEGSSVNPFLFLAAFLFILGGAAAFTLHRIRSRRGSHIERALEGVGGTSVALLASLQTPDEQVVLLSRTSTKN